ncbi:vacuolar protein sorting-associated protein 8 homolog [Scaptodrosophila lebanonensis]|uniref:Vacuolar protein sorting-associated protein 8 homolog n=1 Tax=Drosophila lebanonensis TaxID=7225 RepID=A0A6J2TEZ7_DROLE|nr:vacuolar protein sorting-associated protein 8 homolog [Scaptodrosophila lebanonensis]
MSQLKAPSLQSLLESDRGSTDSLLAESLQLDFEDLDDAEFHIPPTDVLPSLETVLSEFEADSDVASEVGVPHATPTPSIAEDSGVRGDGRGSGGGGSIMRYTLLHGISAQLASAAERVNAGASSACAVSAYIAVGTSHGHILNFDVTQTLRWAHQDKHSQGAVSTLAFNVESTRLLAGYARGLVIMLDTQTGDVLRELFDVITPNTGVLHVKWTSYSSLALCADAGGSVWSLNFTRKLGIRGCNSRCLFSGARGEVCAVEPLIMDSQGRHELDQYCIVALATLSKYFIVTVRPRLKVIKYHALQGPADCLPLLAWHLVLIQAADTTRSVDPVIVVGRGNQLFFHQLFMANGRITLLYLRHVQLQTGLLSAHWLGPKSVASLDTSEILHLVDVRSSKELECMDMANAGLVYGSAQFKGLATGGNVSPAFALAGTNACYNSIVSRGTQLYVLGARSLHIIGVRSWSERISYLVKNHRWQEACQLALDGYIASAERPRKRAQAKERIIALFGEYIATTTRVPEYCLGAIIQCLITVGELDLLWTKLWERLHNNSDLFLQHISEHIEQDNIRTVNPVISQALVDYWLQHSPAKLEQLILKLDWMCLDLNQVLKAVKRHNLYRAQIYLNTHALKDYTGALTELLPRLTPEQTQLGNCLLVYVSSCLAGRGYPSGDIPMEQVQQVKHDVLRCLTSQHSSAGDVEELPYPYLRALLAFDTRETLNVISLAFQEPEFNNELGYSHRKRIIYILLEIMTPEKATWSQIGCLLNFIAQQISTQCLPRDKQLLEQVLGYLATEHITNESVRQHSERESAWHELLSNNCLAEISNDMEQLELARRARCFYVVEYLLDRLGRYDNILECYIENSERHETVFAYMERHVSTPERAIYAQLSLHLRLLLQINATEIVRIIALHYPKHIDELLQLLSDSNDERLLFSMLQSLHARQAPLTSEQHEKLLELYCKMQSPDEVYQFLRSNVGYRVEHAISIVQARGLTKAVIYLYEQQQSYTKAFELSMELLREAVQQDSTNSAEMAKQIAELLARAATSLPTEELEHSWFDFLQFILPNQSLQAITKSMLHEASQHIDLHNLVQLIMNTHNLSTSFGDIKDLLMSMLVSSRQETEALRTAAQILCDDLHADFAEQRQVARRGLWVTTMRCVLCRNRLTEQTHVLALGACGHAMHERCLDELMSDSQQCPRCKVGLGTTQPLLQLSNPSQHTFTQAGSLDMSVLQLKAPPRRFC